MARSPSPEETAADVEADVDPDVVPGAESGLQHVDLEVMAEALDSVEVALLGAAPTMTRVQVAESAGVPLEIAAELWHLLGFAHLPDDEVAFTERDVAALRSSWELLQMGVIGPESQAALVRTWGRSFARLAEWQTGLLAGIAAEGDDPGAEVEYLVTDVVPRLEELQSYIWRRHLMSAASRMVAVGTAGAPAVPMTVCFVDIVGYTTRSKNLSEVELVDWIEFFEQEATGVVVDHGGRVIKMIGDEILFVTDDVVAAAEAALTLTERGEDPDDQFPAVRAGIAHGDVVNRLGDVFGQTVNIAARLTSVARPGSVLVDRATHDLLRPEGERDDPFDPEVLAQSVAKVLEVLTPRPGERDEPEPEPAVREPGDLEISAEEPTQPMETVDAGTGTATDSDMVTNADTAAAPGVASGGIVEAAGPGEQPARPAFRFRRMRRISVKGYARLEVWVLRRPKDWEPPTP